MTAPPSVGLVIPYGYVGGAEAWAFRLLECWPEEWRRRLRAVCLGDGVVVDELRERHVPTTVVDVGSSPLSIAAAVPRLRAALRDVDIVWANGLKAAVVAAPARVLGGPPVVWVKHDRSHDARLARPLGRAVRRVVAVSDVVSAPVRRDDIVTIPPPLPSQPARPRTEARTMLLRAAAVVDDDLLVAVMVGRLSPYKQVELGVRSMATAQGWRLLVIGGPDPDRPGERERLAALSRSLGVAERVHLVGEMAGAGTLLSGADATMVLTGFDDEGHGGEGWSTVALEALFAGCPLVGTAAGAPMATWSAGVVDDAPAAVAAALVRLDDADLRRRAGDAGRLAIAAHPTAEQCAARLLDVLSASARRQRVGR